MFREISRHSYRFRPFIFVKLQQIESFYANACHMEHLLAIHIRNNLVMMNIKKSVEIIYSDKQFQTPLQMRAVNRLPCISRLLISVPNR